MVRAATGSSYSAAEAAPDALRRVRFWLRKRLRSRATPMTVFEGGVLSAASLWSGSRAWYRALQGFEGMSLAWRFDGTHAALYALVGAVAAGVVVTEGPGDVATVDFCPDRDGWPTAQPPMQRARGWRSNPLVHRLALELDRRTAPASGSVRIDPHGPEGAQRYLSALVHADEVWFPDGVDAVRITATGSL